MPLAVTAWLRVPSSRIEAQLKSRLLIFSMTATLAGAGRGGKRLSARYRSLPARMARGVRS
jgi:hypothetical protein